MNEFDSLIKLIHASYSSTSFVNLIHQLFYSTPPLIKKRKTLHSSNPLESCNVQLGQVTIKSCKNIAANEISLPQRAALKNQ